jgi:hypothetical protein
VLVYTLGAFFTALIILVACLSKKDVERTCRECSVATAICVLAWPLFWAIWVRVIWLAYKRRE